MEREVMDQKDIQQKIGQHHWIKRWAGSYTFISCSYWGKQYYETLQSVLGVHFDHVLFTHRKGTVSFFVPKQELDHFGRTLAKKVSKDKSIAIMWCAEIKSNGDKLNKAMNSLEGKIPTLKEYTNFKRFFENHLPYHNFMKKTVDYLEPDLLRELLPHFSDARKYTEPIYSKTEVFFRDLAKAIAQKEGANANLLTCLTEEELEAYLGKRVLPKQEELEQRYNESALFFEGGKQDFVFGEAVKDLENHIAPMNTQEKGTVTGTATFPGIIQGTARVIQNPAEAKTFEKGDILVTGMTRPEFMPFIEKAAAIVTDAGGVLCHAAITARELKKPAVVGTESATKMFRDGDLIEVDAEQGKVKVLRNAQ
jgi:phosphohistidine swiveling domain-containing protein